MTTALMDGKRGLIMGVANNHSIAWGIAQALHNQGAELAFTYQGDAFKKRVEPLAASVGSNLVLPCDVEDSDALENVFETLKEQWGTLDFVVHAIAYSDKEELKGRYVDTTRDNFRNTMSISCYSFTAVAQKAAPFLSKNSSLITLTYLGSERVTPNYNVMGVAKAALEASVRYLATDLGPTGTRVNAISAGPMRTLAGSAIADAKYTYGFTRENSPLKRNVLLEEVGNAGLYLASDLSSGVTGEIHFVDAGFNITAIPSPKRD